MAENAMYQVSTLQALAMGYTRSVINAGELLAHGNTGLGTFEGVGGEMIVLGGKCYRADENGIVSEVPDLTGVPFASVTFLQNERREQLPEMDLGSLKDCLNNLIEERFGLNSMHMVRIDGEFEEVQARSESEYHSHHVSLKNILSQTQRSFTFRNIPGSLVCVYYPDYMDGINAPGWHLHFLSMDRTRGGHVFDLRMKYGEACIDKIPRLTIELPTDPAFDTYSLKEASQDEIKQVEQGER